MKRTILNTARFRHIGDVTLYEVEINHKTKWTTVFVSEDTRMFEGEDIPRKHVTHTSQTLVDGQQKFAKIVADVTSETKVVPYYV